MIFRRPKAIVHCVNFNQFREKLKDPETVCISVGKSATLIRSVPSLLPVPMAELKTKKTDADVHGFIETFADTDQKRRDSFELLQLMQDFTGYAPKMWGPTMIGFGEYHYKSERSRQEGDWPLVGFSPRKAAISLYVYSGCAGQEDLLRELGKFKMGKGCIYVKKLSDINTGVLKELMGSTIQHLQEKHGPKP